MNDMQSSYNSFMDTVKNIYSKLTSITSDGKADTIDLSSLTTTPSSYKDIFDTQNVTNPALTIANREMYDFVTAHSRIPIIFNRDRAEWYSKADGLYTKELARLDRCVNSVSKLIQHGSPQ